MKALEPLVFEQIQKCIKQMQCQKFKGYLLDKDCHFNSFILFFSLHGKHCSCRLENTLDSSAFRIIFFLFVNAAVRILSFPQLSRLFPCCFPPCFVHFALSPTSWYHHELGTKRAPAPSQLVSYLLRSKINVGRFDFSKFIYFIIYLDIYYI